MLNYGIVFAAGKPEEDLTPKYIQKVYGVKPLVIILKDLS